MKNLELLLVAICLLAVVFFIIWMVADSKFIEIVLDKKTPIPVFLEYVRERRIDYEGMVSIERCVTVENGSSVYEIDAYVNNVMSDHTYFSTNGSFICSESTHADRTVIAEGTSCPQTLICTDIIGGGKY